MTTIQISDDRLIFFYSQNPDFDVIDFDFINGKTNNLNWENIEQ